MSRFSKVKIKSGEKKHDYKNFKNFSYKVDKVNEADKTGKAEKEDETDQELPPRIESKDEFNKLKNRLLSLKDNRL